MFFQYIYFSNYLNFSLSVPVSFVLFYFLCFTKTIFAKHSTQPVKYISVKLQATMKLNKNAVAYAATSFAATSMNSLFFFYYVKLFLVEYKVSQGWFQFAQVSSLIVLMEVCIDKCHSKSISYNFHQVVIVNNWFFLTSIFQQYTNKIYILTKILLY